MGVGIFGSSSESSTETNITTNTTVDEDNVATQIGDTGGSVSAFSQSSIGGDFITSDFGAVQGGLGVAATAVQAAGKASELAAKVAGQAVEAVKGVFEDKSQSILQKISEPVFAVIALIVGALLLFSFFGRK